MNKLKRLQRNLIPVNIVVAIISLVAAISIMFAPLLTINLGGVAEQYAKIAAEEGDEPNGESASLMNVIEAVGEIKISLNTYDLLAFAFSDDPIDHIAVAASEKIREVEDDVVANLAVEMIPQLIEENAADLDIDTKNLDVPAILDKFDGVFNSQSEEQTQEAIDALVDELQAQAKTVEGEQLITDDMKEEIGDVIQQIIDDVKAELGDEDLTLEAFICVAISKIINGTGWEPSDGARAASAVAVKAIDTEDSESVKGKIYTNYRDLINGLFGTSAEGDNTESPFEDWFAPIREIAMLMVKIFSVVMTFFAVIWFIQFIFAVVHLFCKNKRFMMWYTKLWGFTPCLLFGVMPLLAAWIVPIFIPEAAIYFGLFSAITTLTWISGVCYVLLWLISIFWAFPIKHQIRKLLSQGATYD